MNTHRSNAEMDALARRMAAMEEEALREFGDFFGPRLRAFFLRHGLAVGDAEDLAVSCITNIALKVEQYKPMKNGSFAAWVFTAARHTLVDWWRTHQATVPLSNNLPAQEPPGDDESEPNIEVILAVTEAVAQLSEIDRIIVQLRDLGAEHTYAEISERLRIPSGTARVRHLRALKKLQSILQKDQRLREILARGKNRGAEEVG